QLLVGHGIPISTPASEKRQSLDLFRRRFEANVHNVDRLFAFLMLGQWLFAVLFALLVSPALWEGRTQTIDAQLPLVLLMGSFLTALPVGLILFLPGWSGTRFLVACMQMLWSGLLIQLSGGRIETHFHVFGSLAFLAFYRDWRVFVPAT